MKFEEILERAKRRRLSQAEAASILGMSERTFRRWRGRFEAEGAEGLYDRRLGKVSGHRVPVDTVMEVLELLQGLRQMKFEEILERAKRRRLSQAEAASILGMSERTFRRWRGVRHALLGLHGQALPREAAR